MTTPLTHRPSRTAGVLAVLMLSNAVVVVAAEPVAAAFDPFANLPTGRPVEVSPVEPDAGGFVDPSAEQMWTGPAGTTLPPAGRVVFDLDRGGPVSGADLPLSVSRVYRPGVPRPATSGNVAVELVEASVAEAAGVVGLLMTVTTSGSGQALLAVDYSGFADRFGGAWGARLGVEELPACALTTPQASGCLTPTSIRSVNRTGLQSLSVQLRLDQPRPASAGGRRVLAVVAAAASEGAGDYRATDLSPAGSWMAGGSDGSFTYRYPLRVPPAAGPVPAISLGYSSASHDGRTSGQNSQASWIGDGWGYEPGYIERAYPSCTLDDEGGHNNPDLTGDLCWDRDGSQLTLSLNGTNTSLVRDDGTGAWRAEADANWRIERLGSAASSSAATTEWWRVTTPDGAQYHFSSEAPASASRWTVPVFGNHPGEPCHSTGFASSSCRQAYRWQLDKVVDVHGNMVRYFYAVETGHYGAAGDPENRVTYHRAGRLSRIDYGLRSGDSGVAATGRVWFTPGNRCLADCGTVADPVEENWPDVPFDLTCQAAPCTEQLAPVFFSTSRLVKVTAEVRNSGTTTFRTVDSWTLVHEFKDYGDAEQVTLWLKSIQQTGHIGTAVTLPKVEFGGAMLPNRVDAAAGVPVMWRTRLFSIKTETGAVITLGYGPTECSAGSLPADRHANTMRCFPVRWTPEFFGEPIEDWFHKHVVTSVVETDTTGGGVAVETHYDYSTAGGGTPVLWAFDDSEFTEDKHRTYNQWRGYAQVTTRRGDPAQPQTVTRKRFFRGLHGQPLPAGGTRSVSLTDHEGNPVTDHEALAGQTWETVNLLGTSIISGKTSRYWTRNTATQQRDHDGGDLKAWLIGLSDERTRTLLTGSTWQRSRTTTTFDTQGRPVQVDEFGDTGKSGDESCTRTEYADNPDAGIKTAISRVEVVEVACGTTPSRPGDIANETRTFYDDSTTLGAPPSKGSPTRIDVLDRWDGGPVYVTTSRRAYDALGREVSTTDALNHTTTTDYTPSGAGPVTQSVATNPLGHTLTSTIEPAWGQPTVLVDANGRRTELAYDGIGRSTAVWLPGRNRTTQTASKQFEYLVSNAAPSAVVTRTLNHAQQYVVELVLFDALLRPRQTQTETADRGRLVTEVVYDAQGRVDEEFGPNHNTSPPDPGAIVRVREEDSARRIGYFYDRAGRVVDEVLYNKQVERWRTTTSYGGSTDGFLISVQPPEGAPATATLTDAHGRVVQERTYHSNAPSGPSDALTYQFSPVGRLEQMTDQAGNQWSWEYDLQGRQVVANDPDAGTTTMAYDAAGRLAATTDARGETVVNGYDPLGRQITRTDGNGTLLAEWQYDTARRGIGFLGKATRWVDGNPYVNQVHSVNPQGLITQQSITIPAVEGPQLAGQYWFTQNYYPNGQVSAQGMDIFGDVEGGILAWVYDHVGNPTRLVFHGDDTGTQVIVDEATFTPFNEVLTRRFASDGERHAYQGFVYEEGTRRLLRATFDREASLHAVADLRYSYDPAGNITSIADVPEDLPGNHELQCFQYDHQRRLVEAWAQGDTTGCAATPSQAVLGGPAAYWNSYSHDVTGNRTGQTLRVPGQPTITRTYTYPAAGQPQPHTVQQVTGTDGTMSFGYDPAGHTTGRTIHGQAQTLRWDAEGRLSSVQAVDAAEEVDRMIYTADGERLLRDDGDSVTLFMPQTELTWNRTTDELDATRYFTHAGQVVATCTGQDVADWTWLGVDHHGTTTTHAVNAFTAVEQVRRLDPYGNSRGSLPSAWPGQQHFVAGVQDPTGLIQVGVRSYDPLLGRFISVDPLLAIGNSQQINGYSYANNNPVTATDPSGMLCTPDADSLCPGQDPRSQPAGRPQPRPPQYRDGNQCVEQCGSPADQYLRTHGGAPSVPKGGTTGPVEIGGQGVTYDQVSMELYGVPWASGTLAPRDRQNILHHLVRSNRPVWYAAWEDSYIDPGEAALIIAAEVSGVADAQRCHQGDWASCGWAAASLIPIPQIKLKKLGDGIIAVGKVRDLGRAYCSFPGHTHVLMADGTTKPISEIQPGDQVLATNPETGEQTIETVTAIWVHQDTLVDLLVQQPGRISNGNRLDPANPAMATVSTTTGHPFWNQTDQQWQEPTILDASDRLLAFDGTGPSVAGLLSYTQRHDSAYNLTVAGPHTYYVLAGDTPVLVHNTCGQFVHGELFEHTMQTPRGPVGMLAETTIDGTTLRLSDVAVYGLERGALDQGAVLRELRTVIAPGAAQQGFDSMVITGTRYSGPIGRQVEIVIDLTRYR